MRTFIVMIVTAAMFLIYGGDKTQKEWLPLKAGDPYTADWKKVQKKEDEGLPKSALELVQAIYAKARKDDNHAQQIKALFHILKYRANIEEEGMVNVISELDREIAAAPFPVRPVLESFQAEILWNYFEQNRWKFYNRTETTDTVSPDIRTWSLSRLVGRVSELYVSSIANADSLQRTRLDILDEVIVTRSGSRLYRPSLYDLLAHRALVFFRNDEKEVNKPQAEFEMNDTRALVPAGEFSRMKFETPDSSSLKFRALLIFQELLRSHLYDPSPEALIDLDLLRLSFALKHTFDESKESVYLKTLQDMAQEYRSHSASTLVQHAIAEHYFSLPDLPAEDENANPVSNRQRAFTVCESAMRSYPDSRGAQNCANLRSRILEKVITLQTETTVPPNKDFRIVADYQNLSAAHIRIVKNKYRFADEGDDNEKYINKLLKLPPVRQWKQELTREEDFKTHRCELKIQALPLGFYTILVSADPSFRLKNNALKTLDVWVTELSLISESSDYRKDKNYYVLNSVTGIPIPDVEIRTRYQKYNYKSYRYEWVKGSTYRTDESGKFTMTGITDYYYYSFTLIHKEDQYIPYENFYAYGPGNIDKKDRVTTKIFTDRSLYRPGQTIYFKGIMYQSDYQNLRHSVIRDRTTQVVFYDINYQKIADLKLTTNEYGSFSGTFTAPTGRLNGQMRIQNESGAASVYVEEYKRPKFEVEFNPVKESFKLDETVRVTGTAKAYAGSTIDQAQVRYRVVRQGYFPFWRRIWGYAPSVSAKEIAHGTVTTGAKGEFTVEFTALPDKTFPKKNLPLFTYTVYADVTDVSGETRSGSASVQVGYVALSADIECPNANRKEDTLAIRLTSRNLNGEFEQARGRLTIQLLEQPGHVLRQRLWAVPDRFIIGREDYTLAFPNDVYFREDDWSQWKPARTVYDEPVDTKEKAVFALTHLMESPTGVYLIQFDTRDRYGTPVRVEKYVTSFSGRGTEPAEMSPYYFYPLKNVCEPGDTARFLVGSAYEKARVFFRIEQQGRSLHEEWFELSRSQRIMDIPVEESYRGGITVHFSFVKNQRLYSSSEAVTVPWNNKELKIEFATFRDKLQPGAEEQWKLILTGPKSEKIAAEMVATLYDASLDAFRPHSWGWYVMPWLSTSWLGWSSQTFNDRSDSEYGYDWNKYVSGYTQYYDALNYFEFPFYSFYSYGMYGGEKVRASRAKGAVDNFAGELPSTGTKSLEDKEEGEVSGKKDKKSKSKNGIDDDRDESSAIPPPPPKHTGGLDGEEPGDDMTQVKARTNLNETAFFYPQLRTNEQGEIIISFTIPEALTRWRMMGIAHTPDLNIGYTERTLVTQKELMVQPNAPRFFRESDEFQFAAKISNLSDKTMTAKARLMLFDAISMQPVDKSFGLGKDDLFVNINAGESAPVFWKIKVPKGLSAVTYRVVAKAGEFSDGEESALPVLPNSMLVTESLPLPIRGKQKKSFEFKKLLDSKQSRTLTHEKLTLEMTSNPAWYAVQAMPYMMEYPYECAEQVYSRFYANAISTHIANSNPKIKRVFDAWKDTPALESNLMKNEDLKSLLLQETPWVIQGQNESQRKKRVGLLFDLNMMKRQLESALKKLKDMQAPNGGWPWFAGMPDDRYITQHIVTGFGHLQVLGVKTDQYGETSGMLRKAVEYLDYKMNEDYQYLLKYKIELDRDNLGYSQLHYLYARSYFMDQPVASRYKTAYDYWKNQSQLYWKNWNKMAQGMIALALHRMKDPTTSQAIMKSIKEHALYSEEMGMYWKSDFGYFWYQAPIETQSLLIEAFDEVMNDRESVEAMKVWLLKQKQTQDWKTTKATAEACYALLRRGMDMLASDQLVEITLGDEKLDMQKIKETAEAGTGYFRTSWNKQEVKSSMGKVQLAKKDEGVAWGALYWQYFEELDKITPHETPLKLNKKLFIQRTTGKGLVLDPVSEKTKIQVGDVVVVRIELRVDRTMEYIHMKDMRAAGFEPVNVLSRYKWQDGLGYYESTKDASTNFFISWLPKGTYVFEYPLRASLKGEFQNGITTIQCMYAPEFTSHSEGIKVLIE